MRLVFCGTPQFAVPTLEELASAGHRIELVLTQPDRPSGRGLELTLSPVKQAAIRLGLSVQQPEKIKNNSELQSTLQAIDPEAIVVVGYGRLIPPWMLRLPRFGNINLHASLLPAYRGAAPIQWAIAHGENVTGVTTMLLDEGLDTGDILLQQSERIAPDDTSLTLAPRLAGIGAPLVRQTLDGLRAGTIVPGPQDSSRATLAPILTREDGEVRFNRAARDIYNRLRGFQPWPGAWTRFRGKKLTIHDARPIPHTNEELRPGEIRDLQGRLVAGCGESTAIELLEVQLEGKKRVSGCDFLRGYRLAAGETFESRQTDCHTSCQ